MGSSRGSSRMSMKHIVTMTKKVRIISKIRFSTYLAIDSSPFRPPQILIGAECDQDPPGEKPRRAEEGAPPLPGRLIWFGSAIFLSYS